MLYRVLLITLGSIVVLGAGLYGWSRVSPTEIHTEIEIDAPVEDVWHVLTGFSEYEEWNPFMVKASGEAQVGETLVNTLVTDGSTMTIKPQVTVADPGQELRWLGRFVLPGVVEGEHYFLLEPTSDNGTRLVHGETFTGMLVPFAGGMLDVGNEFELMNQALKARAEGLTH
ncbi:SRPBCC domain-containing protein [Phytoactinopolyspora mesophila]|uniref:SRPBCC domain-containing protein n=1 Tax=Phytoactinopolyspora mesophila TaxID=2650750 RepID=A0A7K3LYG6_9ACTN|nr:SRPBCC domain-containing protein [Phytoactinopolyspora mesophila]NDL56030.1 SRPBCC domain-containing protein [Phytoactinopolyspora mesophila]